DERAKGGGGYLRLGLGSNPDIRAEMLTQITGLRAYTEDFPKGFDYQGKSPDRQLLDTLREKLDNGFPVLVGTKGYDPKRPVLDKELVVGHAYEVTAVDDMGRIKLRDPHNMGDPELLTLAELRKNFKNRYTTLE
ncbi:hypothetical protein ACFV06_42055, partial [Streptomyces sp. NPDC059618]|uniref:hypothetical protein n=1 Tax=Streptomyces sp. NPDC059618 TaxID=3346887 RepID=UPI0036BB7C5F